MLRISLSLLLFLAKVSKIHTAIILVFTSNRSHELRYIFENPFWKYDPFSILKKSVISMDFRNPQGVSCHIHETFCWSASL